MGAFKKCAVTSCVTNSKLLRQTGVTLRYYSFPKEKKLLEEWLHRCSKQNYNELLKSDTICSRHFHIDDFVDALESKVLNIKPKKLKPGAIPSLFLEKRPEKLLNLKRNSLEYHMVLAQEILAEEKQAASTSSELPLLEFTKHNSAHNLVNPELSKKSAKSQRLKNHRPGNIDPQEDLGGGTIIDIKEESIIKPYVDINDCDENPAEDIDCVRSKSNINDFIGNCYVCDKKIRKSDASICDDFTKIIQKVLGDISPDYVVVIKKDDGMCGTCRDLMARILRLEAELRTSTLGIRALLRLKYSLPPPPMVNKTPVEQIKLQVEVEHKKIWSSSRGTKLKDRMTQTNKSFYGSQKHKQTQTASNLVLKNIQKISTSHQKNTEMKTIVSSINDIEILETGRSEVTVDKETDQSKTCSLQTSPQILSNECLFEDISDISDLTTLLNDNYLAEESVVVTEETHEADTFGEENKSALKKKTQLHVRLLKCARCSFKTKSAEKMKTHILSFKNKEGFYCSICDFAYHIQNRFKRHQICHSETSKDKRCIFCNEKIHDKLHMRFHIEASHRKNSFAHKCSICNGVFMFDHQKRKHQRLKHKMRILYKCEKCKKAFGDKIKYDNHIEFFHRDSLACKYCLRVCTSIKKLIVHENTLHRFDRKGYYKCSYCPKRFLRQDLLPLHEEQHTGTFEFRCDLCDYGFHEAELLKKHQTRCKPPISLSRKLSPKNVNSPSRINYVEQQLPVYKPSSRKFQNEPSHGSLVCDVCGKVIITRQKYKIHRELHDNPAGFQCHMCGKKFRYEGNMITHIKNQHMDKPE